MNLHPCNHTWHLLRGEHFLKRLKYFLFSGDDRFVGDEDGVGDDGDEGDDGGDGGDGDVGLTLL